jgi:hypothetical protein
MAACTGAQMQYLDMASCMTGCSYLPMGTYGTAGETLGCHQAHADMAGTAPTTECANAGPFGSGVCGSSQCQDYCLLAASRCAADAGFAVPYASVDQCVSLVCNGTAFPYNPDAAAFNAAGPAPKNTLNCLEWHDNHALQSPGTHCPHLEIDGGAGMCGHL